MLAPNIVRKSGFRFHRQCIAGKVHRVQFNASRECLHPTLYGLMRKAIHQIEIDVGESCL